jgi:TATA-binding protein-associated factor Taf7
MGDAKEHLRKFSELSEKIAALGKTLRQAEKDMESTWTDQIEMRDLQDVKRRLKEVEDTLCMMQEEVGHIEAKHCKET